MKPHIDDLIHLLHGAHSGALATHSLHAPGYPFASALPFVPDETHCPLFLLSGLAEHTRNLVADGRASLLVTDPAATDVLAGTRMTLTGPVERVEMSSELAARYLRYRPEAAQYIGLGDFSFFRLIPAGVRHIAGFARMGWLDETDWRGVQALPPADEAGMITALANDMPAGMRLLGIDAYGFDLDIHGERRRMRFTAAPASPETIRALVKSLLPAG